MDEQARRQAQRLEGLRLERIERLVRRNREIMEMDVDGAPARRGELLVMDASEDELARAAGAGYEALGHEVITGLDITIIRMGVPKGRALARAQVELARLMPGASVSADNLHFASQSVGVQPSNNSTSRMASKDPSTSLTTPIGVIDGAPGEAFKVRATRGFAIGAPHPSDHGSAVVSLLEYAGAENIRVADVYGTDKAGGNALAIARGLGWLVEGGSKVVNISLVGPANALIERAIASARKKGVVIVAAVGNDGPAAPPAYPASYDGVVAVTGVDKRNRALIEAGRALDLDYAAPGAEIYGRNAGNRRAKLRGTSFAGPLVASRVAAALLEGRDWRAALDAEARDLGAKGIDPVYGRGLVCGACRPR